ncbi:PhzF family phenazine biosynthesis protein [Aggregatibacter actinomycetemcomitans]|nr:PhzF family phenazine biosynthesis protein [Aggregatibacter actinomycetemcomitans]
MKRYTYHLVNVFAENHFGGNPLAVFPEADGLNTQQMQLIARQFNLSETVFLHQTENPHAVRKLRIFTPDYELPFAGHPTIGSAFIAQRLFDLPDYYQFDTQAGLVSLEHQDQFITFSLNKAVITAPSPYSDEEFAALLGLQTPEILETRWINTGSNQLFVRVNSIKSVESCQIQPLLFEKMVGKDNAIYIWFEENQVAKVRLFFMNGGSIVEDPGTGSAAANLGGWCILNKRYPMQWQITQGDEINRPNRLTLCVDEHKTIYVGGKAILVGEGQFYLP